MTNCTALKPGDEVFICSSGGICNSMARTVVKTVQRIHFTVTAAGDVKFRRKGGHEAGSTTGWTYIRFIVPVSTDSEATYLRQEQDAEDRAARVRLRESFYNVNIPIERVRACLAILEAPR